MYKSRLQQYYLESGKNILQKRFGYLNPMEVPSLEKIVISVTTKDAVLDSKVMDNVSAELMLITGQKPLLTIAKKSIAGFKLRENSVIGCKVTLRRHMMYEFLDRFINIVLPRFRDFKGVNPKSFDGNGNFSIGLKEQIVFPEIVYDKIDKVRGMNIAIITTAKTDEEAKALLATFDMPFLN